jgi:hypothetical protein
MQCAAMKDIILSLFLSAVSCNDNIATLRVLIPASDCYVLALALPVEPKQATDL